MISFCACSAKKEQNQENREKFNTDNGIGNITINASDNYIF